MFPYKIEACVHSMYDICEVKIKNKHMIVIIANRKIIFED